jgi:hypothetical protein
MPVWGLALEPGGIAARLFESWVAFVLNIAIVTLLKSVD